MLVPPVTPRSWAVALFATVTVQYLLVSSFHLRPQFVLGRSSNPCFASHVQSDAVSIYGCETTSDEQTAHKEYFVSEAMFVHLGPAAHILTEAFYSHRTNFITFQIEKLKTALSLESTFKQRNNPMGQMFVACSSVTGKVVGFAEVDVCSLKKDCDEVRECSIDDSGKSNDLPRPYMYNLAVDKRWQRKGIATALVTACENFVANTEQSIHDQSIIKYRLQEHSHLGLDSACKEFVEDTDEEGRWIYLRVRKNNNGAISFYRRLGYDEIDPVTIGITYSDVNSNSGEEGELILMAKELNTDS